MPEVKLQGQSEEVEAEVVEVKGRLKAVMVVKEVMVAAMVKPPESKVQTCRIKNEGMY